MLDFGFPFFYEAHALRMLVLLFSTSIHELALNSVNEDITT